MRIGVLLFGILVPITFGLATPSFADSFAVGQAVILKAQKPVGVPLHHDAKPSYWKHVQEGVSGKIRQIAHNGWLFLSLATGEDAWVHPQYVKKRNPIEKSQADDPIRQPEPSHQSPKVPTQTFHESPEQEEALVWTSREGCHKVVEAGGRMAPASSDRLRVGTWNIRWFPYGQPPDRSRHSAGETDLPWLICTLTWMNLDVLAIEESLDTSKAKQAWKTVVTALAKYTGETWQWTPQRCGDPESHKIGYLWNASRVKLTKVRSLKAFNVKAQSTGRPCEGGLRPGHYSYVESNQQPGVDFHLIALHLKSGPTVFALEDRHRALNRIDQTVGRFLSKDQDIVILGDFNTMGAGDNASRRSELKYMRRMVSKEMPGFQDLPLTPQCSHYFRGRGGWLDHVLVNHGMEEVQTRSARVTGYCAIAKCQRIKGDYPPAYQRLSDHCPVTFEIENQDRD